MRKCHIGDMITLDRVVGMGEVPTPSELWHYVPLTGREPLLQETGSVWVIQITGDLYQPGGGDVWQDPTCVVTRGDFGWFATGPVRSADGKVFEPVQPERQPDRRLPPLAP
jgi:hypothetical protein